MIASVFSKSKPINIIIVSGFMVLALMTVEFKHISFSFKSLSAVALNLGVLVFSLFVFDFINSKNNLTAKNSYAILCFGVLILFSPDTITNPNYLWSNLLVLFAIRRLISLHSKRRAKKKLFDATFWICLAAIFNPWALLFLILIILSLVYYSGNDIKTSAIPILGVLCVATLKMCYNIIVFDRYVLESDYSVDLELRNPNYVTSESIFTVLTLGLLVIWSLTKLLATMGERNAQAKPSYILIFWATLIATAVSLLSPAKNGNEFIYCVAPVALVMALNIETLKKPWLINTVVSCIIAIPVIKIILWP